MKSCEDAWFAESWSGRVSAVPANYPKRYAGKSSPPRGSGGQQNRTHVSDNALSSDFAIWVSGERAILFIMEVWHHGNYHNLWLGNRG